MHFHAAFWTRVSEYTVTIIFFLMCFSWIYEHRFVALWLLFAGLVVTLFGLFCYFHECLVENPPAAPKNDVASTSMMDAPGVSEASSPSAPPAATTVPATSDGKSEVLNDLTYLSTPTPREIFDTVSKATPLARDAAGKQYVGAPVTWNLEFRSGGSGYGKTRLYFRFKDNDDVLQYLLGPVIGCEIDISKHSFLLQLPADSPVNVKGIIEEVATSGDIKLKEVTVRLREPSK
jgi:hypothetical protein